MNVSNVETRLNLIENLPSLPMVINQIQQAIINPKSSMGQISSIIEKDQALSLRTLKLVNSAYYGFRQHISSIKNAIIILGLEEVHNLMLGLSIIKIFKNKGSKIIDHNAFWEHTLGCAMIAKQIAQQIEFENVEDCFIAGLLHDMGRIVLEQYFHEEYSKTLSLLKENNDSLLKHESQVFGFTHGEVGAFLAMKWKIPVQLIVSMKYHHFLKNLPPEFIRYRKMIYIVAKANQLCHKYNIGNSMEPAYVQDHDLQEISLAPNDVDNICLQAKKEVKETLQQWQI